MYRLSAYWLAKQTSELPLILTLPLIYYVVVYWCIGLAPEAWVFVVQMLTFLLFSLTNQVWFLVLYMQK